jgi:hypothetical protein
LGPIVVVVDIKCGILEIMSFNAITAVPTGGRCGSSRNHPSPEVL